MEFYRHSRIRIYDVMIKDREKFALNLLNDRTDHPVDGDVICQLSSDSSNTSAVKCETARAKLNL